MQLQNLYKSEKTTQSKDPGLSISPIDNQQWVCTFM